jgi:uncharacterized protein (DUF427 family)
VTDSWNPPEPHVTPSPRWVRVRVGADVVADSRRAVLVAWYGPTRLPTYCVPEADVRTALLRPSARPATEAFGVAHDVVAGDVVVEGGAQRFVDPPTPLTALDGLWTFTWDDDRLQWFEEALPVHVHARDTAKRVDAVPSERHVRVELDGVVVAESRRPTAVFETPLPPRWYLPPDDVRWDLLTPTGTVTRCPYKGTARYWTATVGGAEHVDVAWSYPEPVVECPRIAGLVAFFDERADVVIDGVRQERPRTPWSP